MNYVEFAAEVAHMPWALLDSWGIEQLGAYRQQLQDKPAPEPFCITASGERVSFAASDTRNNKLIAVIPVYGVICDWGVSPARLSQRIREAVANKDVSAIVLDFDSPGGSVYGVDELAGEIFAARGQKKIVAQVNPLCASAAYYLASQCSEIAIMPSGEVGSIGVRMMWVGYKKALEAAGIEVRNIYSGKFKVEGNPYDELSDSAFEWFQKRCDEYYAPFLKAVARGRGIKSADVRTGMGQGRVLGALEAKSEGMVDRIATFDETLARLGGAAVSASGMGAVTPGASAKAESESECQCDCDPCRDGDCSGCSHEGCDCAGCACNQEDDDEEPEEQASAPASVTTAEAEQKEVLDMSTVATPAAAAATANTAAIQAAVQAEKDRCTQLTALANQHGMGAKLDGWLKGGISVEAAQTETLMLLRSTARSVGAFSGDGSGVQIVKDADDKVHGSVRVARMMRCLAFAKGDKRSAAQRAEVMGDKVVANAFLAAAPQNASTLTEGGAFVPENFVPDLIEFLRPLAVFRSLNPAAYPLVNGNLSLPKLTGGGIATYVGEVQPIPVSKAKTGNVKGSAKKLAAIIPMGNDLVRFSGLSADAAFRDDMVLAVGQGEDSALIRAEGSLYTPKGLRYQALPANIVASLITKALIDNPASNISVLIAVVNDLSNMLKRMANANVRFLRPGWIISRRTEFFLKYQVRDGLGNLVFKEEMDRGMLLGYPYKATTVIPNNLGGGGIDSEIYVADFADVVLADAPTIAIEVSNEATYVDADGVQHNAFQEDVTLIRFIEEHDLLVRHEESIQVLTAVQYGA